MLTLQLLPLITTNLLSVSMNQGFKFYLFLFWAVLGAGCSTRASLIMVSGGYSLVAVHRLLAAVAALIAEHGLQDTRAQQLRLLRSRAPAQPLWRTAQLLRGMWDLPRSRTEPVSPALAGRFFTTEPPEKPQVRLFFTFHISEIIRVFLFWTRFTKHNVLKFHPCCCRW